MLNLLFPSINSLKDIDGYQVNIENSIYDINPDIFCSALAKLNTKIGLNTNQHHRHKLLDQFLALEH